MLMIAPGHGRPLNSDAVSWITAAFVFVLPLLPTKSRIQFEYPVTAGICRIGNHARAVALVAGLVGTHIITYKRELETRQAVAQKIMAQRGYVLALPNEDTRFRGYDD